VAQELGVDQFAAQDLQCVVAGLAGGDGEVQVGGWLDQVLRFLLLVALVLGFFGCLCGCGDEGVECLGCGQAGRGIDAVYVGERDGVLADAALCGDCAAGGGLR